MLKVPLKIKIGLLPFMLIAMEINPDDSYINIVETICVIQA